MMVFTLYVTDFRPPFDFCSFGEKNLLSFSFYDKHKPQNVSKLATFFKHRFAPPAFIYGEKTTQIMGDGFPNLFTKLSNRSQFVA